MSRPTARVVALLVVATLATACARIDTGFVGTRSTPPDGSSPPVPASVAAATLGLHLFVNGKIIEVTDGDPRVIARWPSRSAPYLPPIETPHGFIGLARDRERVDLWLVRHGRNTCLGSDVARGFAVSAGARRVVYGRATYRSGGYETQLHVATLPGGRTIGSVAVDGYAVPVGFVGNRVVLTIGDGLGGASVWDPTTEEVELLNGYRGAGATDPTSRRALIYAGAVDRAWVVGSWGDDFAHSHGGDLVLSRPAFSPQGRWLAGIRGPEYGSQGRLDVYNALDARPYFLSRSIPGAFQPAWEDESTALVLARHGERAYIAYRCRPGDGIRRPCADVWSGESGGRDSAWLIPTSASPLGVARDDGRGFAMWPEHRGLDARRSCAAPPEWRKNPHTTAEEFGRRVLGWVGARAEVDHYEHFGVQVTLRRADGLPLEIWLHPVSAGCWSVTGAARSPDGVSASVRGRRVQVSIPSLGAISTDVIVGFNGREIRERVISASGASVRLSFKPSGSGYCIVLHRDFAGRVFSATGALLYPHPVAG